jgi:hypothetical protein
MEEKDNGGHLRQGHYTFHEETTEVISDAIRKKRDSTTMNNYKFVEEMFVTNKFGANVAQQERPVISGRTMRNRQSAAEMDFM